MTGVYTANKANGQLYYRASITYKGKHISLGSFTEDTLAHKAYLEAYEILFDGNYNLQDYGKIKPTFNFDKWVILHNYRDNNMYFKTPIYIRAQYFLYYLEPNLHLKFDVDDLFYYANHTIMKRGGYLFVADYGMQINILSRYGIRNFAVAGKDYCFINGDSTDFRYANIKVINRYYGVYKTVIKNKEVYVSKIHLRGDYIIGKYYSEIEAAIAYNKAVDILKSKGVDKLFNNNYIEDIGEIEYAKIYHSVKISKKIRLWENV